MCHENDSDLRDSEVPLKGKIKHLSKYWGGRQHRTTPAGQISGGRDPCRVDAYGYSFDTKSHDAAANSRIGQPVTDMQPRRQLGTSAGFWLGGSMPPYRPRRRKFRKFNYEMVHSEVYLNKYVVIIAPFCTPACPDCFQNIT